jgi:hypothetical protein
MERSSDWAKELAESDELFAFFVLGQQSAVGGQSIKQRNMKLFFLSGLNQFTTGFHRGLHRVSWSVCKSKQCNSVPTPRNSVVKIPGGRNTSRRMPLANKQKISRRFSLSFSSRFTSFAPLRRCTVTPRPHPPSLFHT